LTVISIYLFLSVFYDNILTKVLSDIVIVAKIYYRKIMKADKAKKTLSLIKED